MITMKMEMVGVSIEMHRGIDDDMMIIIVGWGVVPIMALHPSQGSSMLGERERDSERTISCVSFIPHKRLI